MPNLSTGNEPSPDQDDPSYKPLYPEEDGPLEPADLFKIPDTTEQEPDPGRSSDSHDDEEEPVTAGPARQHTPGRTI